MAEVAQFFGALFFILGIWCGWQNNHGPKKPKFKINWKPDNE